MRYGVYVLLSSGRQRPYRPDVRTRRKAERIATRVNSSEPAARFGWRAFVLDRDQPWRV
jgi:hypothetical protein